MPSNSARVVFMGSPDVAIPSLNVLHQSSEIELVGVYSQPSRPVGRKRVLTPPPVAQYALDHELPLFQPESMKTEESFDLLKQLSPDLIIVCAYGQILPQRVLDLPSLGCFNSHFSFLPRWRGASPIQAAIREGDSHTGACLQKMVFRLDAGDVVATSAEIPISPDTTSATLAIQLQETAAVLLKDTLPALLAQSYSCTPQDESQATFCHIIKKTDGVIDWSQDTAIHIARRLRAYTPWPGVSSFLNGKRVQFGKVEVLAHTDLAPAEIGDGLLVGTQEGTLQILELKPEGKPMMLAKDFLNGNPQAVGQFFEQNIA